MTNPEPDPRPDQPAAETGAREGKAGPAATVDLPYRKCCGCGRDLGLNESGRCGACWLASAEAMALAACLGTGAPGEPTPLQHLDALLLTRREELEQDAADRPEVSFEDRFAPLEAVERLARELRAAVARAERD